MVLRRLIDEIYRKDPPGGGIGKMTDNNGNIRREDPDESIEFIMSKRRVENAPSETLKTAPQRPTQTPIQGQNGAKTPGRAPQRASYGQSGERASQRPHATGSSGSDGRQMPSQYRRNGADGVHNAAKATTPIQRTGAPAGSTRHGTAAAGVDQSTSRGAADGSARAFASGGGVRDPQRNVSPADLGGQSGQGSGAKIGDERSHDPSRSAQRPEKGAVSAKDTKGTKDTRDKKDGNRDKKVSKEERDVGGFIATNAVRAIVYLVVCTVIGAILSVAVINVGNDMFAFVKSDDIIEVEIPENATTSDVAEVLYENGVIEYKSMFKLYGKLKKKTEDFVAGEYSVTPMMSYSDLFAEFKPKPLSGTSRITIPEGYTVDEMIDLMLSYNIGTKEGYVKVINEGNFDYWFVKELKENESVMAKVESGERFYLLEGYLFPDTYEFYNASDEWTVINKILARFDEIYTEKMRERAAELGRTTDEVVTLASMIEKEAGMASDFRTVSSVFYNRLSKPGAYPKFQSDATVVYAIHHATGERPKNVNSETISYKSSYNTYQVDGFPPSAIANPGMNALKYALYPADTDYYYFVSSGDTTLFGRNAAEHQSNINSLR